MYHWTAQWAEPCLRHANSEEGVDSNTDGAGVQWYWAEQGTECQATRSSGCQRSQTSSALPLTHPQGTEWTVCVCLCCAVMSLVGVVVVVHC